MDGQLAANATEECNSPCTGNKTTVCGGVNRLNVFEPTGFEGDEIGSDVSEDFGIISSGESADEMSGATRIRALF